MTASLFQDVVADLVAEHESLGGMLNHMGDRDWDRGTPAVGWTCRDQVSHLAFFDDMATLAITDPASFAVEVDIANPDTDRYMQRHLEAGRGMAPDELLGWWREASARLLAVLQARGDELPGRLPWYGPPMGLVTFVTARLMEAWAHGQDVADALGIRRRPTSRLRHIAELGIRTRRYSYGVRGLVAPEDDIEVRLWSPGGEEWVWAVGAAESIRGPAEDFALVVTQRRHVDDTALQLTGATAREWMLIAQTFAGAPGAGREPVGSPRPDVREEAQ